MQNLTPARLRTAAQGDGRPNHDSIGTDTSVVIKAMTQLALDCLVYAEGDSCFDKFSPIPSVGTNLLEEIRTPYVAGVVDVAHVGDDGARDMVRGWQACRTREMFRLLPFKAILLSAGGNDLKNLFSDLFGKLGLQRAGLTSRISASDLEAWPRLPGSACQSHRLPSGSAWKQARRFWRIGLEPFELGFEVRTISVPFAGATVAYSVRLKFIKEVAQYGPTEDLLGGAGDRLELEAADNASLANHPTQLVGHFPVDEDGIAR